MQVSRLAICALAAQLLTVSMAVAAPPDEPVGTERQVGRESLNRDSQSIWGYIAMETTPAACDGAPDPWDCAETNLQGLRDWYSDESHRLRDLRNGLSWTTAFGAGCLVVVGEKAGQTTSQTCILASLAPLIYDDLTVITYRKKLIDKASEMLDSMRSRYSPIKNYVNKLETSSAYLISHPAVCDQIAADIIKLEKFPQDSAIKSLKKELSSIYTTCIEHREFDREILDTMAIFRPSGPVVQTYVSYYSKSSSDIYNAYNDTVATPNETFSTLIASPFSAISKALKDGAGLQTYTSKRTRSPDVFNFTFPALVELSATARPLPPDTLREGLSEDAQDSVNEIASKGDILAKAKLADSDVRAMAAHARLLGNTLSDRLPFLASAKAALDSLRAACAPYSVTIDLRASPVEGATPAEK